MTVAQRNFVYTFAPAHVALMEAVCEADDPEPPKSSYSLTRDITTHWMAWRKRQDARDALSAFRKEHHE